MFLFLLLLDALSSDNNQTTVMARHRGAPQVVYHEEAIADSKDDQNRDDADEISESDQETIECED